MTTTVASPRTVARAGGLHPVGVFILLAGAFLPIMDFFITNVALPSIDASLHASASSLELVIAGYGVSYAALLVLGGRLGDRYGRHRIFRGALAGFVLASLACGFAPTAAVLIGARIVQGATAALLVPQVLATCSASPPSAPSIWRWSRTESPPPSPTSSTSRWASSHCSPSARPRCPASPGPPRPRRWWRPDAMSLLDPSRWQFAVTATRPTRSPSNDRAAAAVEREVIRRSAEEEAGLCRR